MCKGGSCSSDKKLSIASGVPPCWIGQAEQEQNDTTPDLQHAFARNCRCVPGEQNLGATICQNFLDLIKACHILPSRAAWSRHHGPKEVGSLCPHPLARATHQVLLQQYPAVERVSNFDDRKMTKIKSSVLHTVQYHICFICSCLPCLFHCNTCWQSQCWKSHSVGQRLEVLNLTCFWGLRRSRGIYSVSWTLPLRSECKATWQRCSVAEAEASVR